MHARSRPRAFSAGSLVVCGWALLLSSACVQKIDGSVDAGADAAMDAGTTGQDPDGGGGELLTDACVPATCETVGAACGDVPDGCGGTLQCQCALGLTCDASVGSGTCGCPSTGFRSRVADTGQSFTGLFNSLVVDSEGGLHLAYADGDHGFKYLYHPARASGFVPVIETVEDTKAVSGTSLAVDGQGRVHVAYYLWDSVSTNIWNAELWYARRSTDGAWTKSRVVAAGEMVYVRADHAALAVDASGSVHLLYYTFTYQTADVWHATSDTGAGWVTERVAPGVEHPSWTAAGTLSLRFDGAGALHALYFDYGTRSLKHAVRSATGSWSVAPTPVATPSVSDEWAGTFSSLVVDPQNVLHATWVMERTNSSALWYGVRDGAGNWQAVQVDPAPDGTAKVGLYNALARGPDGTLHVAYYDAATQDLKYAARSKEGIWSAVTADSAGSVGGHAALGVAPEGTLHVAYFELVSQSNRTGQLRYASRCR